MASDQDTERCDFDFCWLKRQKMYLLHQQDATFTSLQIHVLFSFIHYYLLQYAGGFATLVDAYPKWCHVSKLACENDKDKVTLAELLYQNGLLMAVFD